RWQDRGEVEDSDEDEELSLGNESQSPQKSSKRPRLEGGKYENEDRIGALEVEEGDERGPGVKTNESFTEQYGQEAEEPWLQPRSATTYSRRVKAVQVKLPKTALAARPEQTSNLSLASPVHSPEVENTKADHQDAGGNSTLLQRSEKEDERKAVDGQNTTPLANQYSCTNAEDSSRDVPSGDRVLERSRNPPAYTENATKVTQQVQLQDVTPNANSGGETLTDRSDSLPSVGQMLERHRENTPSRQNDILSASSSPLSEREVSPPPGFVLPLADRQTSFLISQHPDSNERLESNVDDAIDDLELAQGLRHPDTAIAARRSLRTRKEKQLHPYEYEKAIYQRQMRQRGYKPIRFA
ncbi:hypothetical protein KC343_g21730, partial [Hortaea werneckii]